MTVSEKAAYLRGLMDAMNLDKASNEGKLFYAISDLLDDLALSVADLEEETSAMRDYIDEMDDDLAAVESDLYGDEDYPYYDDEDDEEDEEDDGDESDDSDDYDEDEDDYDEEEDEEDDEDDEDDDEVVGLECPACGETVYCAIDDLENMETLICPACGKELDVVRMEDLDDEEPEEEGKEEGSDAPDEQPQEGGFSPNGPRAD